MPLDDKTVLNPVFGGGESQVRLKAGDSKEVHQPNDEAFYGGIINGFDVDGRTIPKYNNAEGKKLKVFYETR